MNSHSKSRSHTVLVLAAGLLVLAAVPGIRAQEGAVEGHIRQVLLSASNTPDGEGLLPTAEAEAAVAIRHAELAANDDTNLDWMQTHAGHVLHALNPDHVMGDGPGLGYGLQPALDGIVEHTGLAANVEGVAEGVETHATHVIAASNATAGRAAELADLAQQVLDAGDYSTAGSRVFQMRRVARQLQSGVDADEDGQISWRAPEGGLDHVRQHAELMARAAGVGLD